MAKCQNRHVFVVANLLNFYFFFIFKWFTSSKSENIISICLNGNWHEHFALVCIGMHYVYNRSNTRIGVLMI